VVYERNLTSFQSKKSPDWSASMGAVEVLSLTLTDLHVPALTSRLDCGESALQLSENTTLFAIYRIYISSTKRAVSFIYRLYRIGDGTELRGTPACISRGVDSSPSTITLNFLLERNELVSLIKLNEKCNSDSLCSKPGCHVVSDAFSISKKTAAANIFLLKFRVTWSVRLMH